VDRSGRRTRVNPYAFGERAVRKHMDVTLTGASHIWRTLVVSGCESGIDVLRDQSTPSVLGRRKLNPMHESARVVVLPEQRCTGALSERGPVQW
jgi:hypothetical protein